MACAGVLLLASCSEPIALPPEPGLSTPATAAPYRPRPLLPYPPDLDATATVPVGFFPRPRQLGPQWAYAPFPAVAGERGTGGRVLIRALDVAQMGAASLPTGCLPTERTPVPRSAGAVRYSFQDTPVVALLLSFDRGAEAEEFLAVRSVNLRGCGERELSLERMGSGLLVWSGAGVRGRDREATRVSFVAGRAVVQLFVAAGGDASSFEGWRAVQLAARFRSLASRR